MRVGVIGASGKAGSLIIAEAKNRGHDVTAIVRDASKVAGLGYRIIEKDLFDLTADDLRDFDAVVSAFGTPFGQNREAEHQRAMEHLISVFEKLPDVRLLVVGGAGSLYASADKKRRAYEDIPEQWRAVPLNMAAAFEKLRESKVNWTYFSPAVNFDPAGERTGKYVLGSDFVLKNKQGHSYISYADYAVAMVDEIEESRFPGARFTAVSEGKPAERPGPGGPAKPKEEYYGIGEMPVFEGISQYCEPLCFELASKKYTLLMDNGEEYLVNFTSEEDIEWQVVGDKKHKDNYQCLKADNTTFFVNIEVKGSKPRTGMTLILDMEQRLVTIVKTYAGFSSKYPMLVQSEFLFGAIDIPGFELPTKRHGYTTDLVGKRIEWTYSPKFTIMHVYYHPNYVRAPVAIDVPEPVPEFIKQMKSGQGYDEPATYIKVKDWIYIVEINEQVSARRGHNGNSLLFLMNLKRLHDVGRSFGHSGERKPENYLFSAFGKWVKSDGSIEAFESLYRT
jgi:putative NADH-flavin reductase